MHIRWASVIAAGLVLGLATPPTLSAQGTADIPLEDNAYNFIDALLNRGVLRSLSSLERPYSLADVRKALDADHAKIDESRVLLGYSIALRRALRKYDAGTYDARLHRPPQDSGHSALLRYNVGLDLWATGQTSSIREVMEDNEQRAVYPGGDIRLLGEAGPVTVVFQPVVDGRLLRDPQFMIGENPKDNARMQDAYIDARWPIAEAFFGRESRNWGPPDLDGLLLGHYVYSYDHFYGRIGPKAIHLEMIFARLNDMVNGDTLAERYFSIHRLATSWHTFEFALTESIIYGGPGQGFNLSYLNPLDVFFFTQNNETTPHSTPYITDNGNKAYAAEIAWRSRTFGNFAGEAYLDDYQLNALSKCAPLCQKPNSYGLTAEIDGFPLVGQQKLFAYYTLVTNLSYRDDNPYETYDQWGLGLGRGYSDYDEARIGVDLAAIPQVPLKVYAGYRRQGQGNYRIPEPAPDSFAVTPTIFSGIVSHIERVGVIGAVTTPYIEISGDVGVNHASNYNNVAGITRTSIAGTIKLTLSVARLFGGTIRPPGD